MKVRFSDDEPNVTLNIDGIDYAIDKDSLFIGNDEDERVPRIKVGGLVEGENMVFKFPFSDVLQPSEDTAEDLFATIIAYTKNHGHGPGTLATESYVDDAVQTVQDVLDTLFAGSDLDFDTLKEIADGLSGKQNAISKSIVLLLSQEGASEPSIDLQILKEVEGVMHLGRSSAGKFFIQILDAFPEGSTVPIFLKLEGGNFYLSGFRENSDKYLLETYEITVDGADVVNVYQDELLTSQVIKIEVFNT